jgi:hypothetical protein
MIFWKEWRETRFGFLTALFFVSGIFFTIPTGHDLEHQYWLGVILVLFSMGFALMLGSGAFASETGAGTLQFLLSKPAGKFRFLLTKFGIRGFETALIFLIPATIGLIRDSGLMIFLGRLLNINDPSSLAPPALAARWEAQLEYMWVPPYLFPQYVLLGLLIIIFLFCASFFFSVLISRRVLPAMGGLVFFATFLSVRGMAMFQSVYYGEQVKEHILLLLASTLGLLALSTAVFAVKEY